MYQLPEAHDVPRSLGIQLLLHFKLQGQLGRNRCESCQAWKHETNSPRRGCGVKHRDKEQTSHRDSRGLRLHTCNRVIDSGFDPFTHFWELTARR